MTESDLNDLLNQLFSDAVSLDKGISSLSQQYGNPPNLPLQVFIGIPYFNPRNTNLVLNGQSYDLSQLSQRLAATKWYLNKISAQYASVQ